MRLLCPALPCPADANPPAGGRPAADRVWQECFAQLVGTILSLWDASELDKVSGDTEVLPTFINLTDAAIHMVGACQVSADGPPG